MKNQKPCLEVEVSVISFFVYFDNEYVMYDVAILIT